MSSAVDLSPMAVPAVHVCQAQAHVGRDRLAVDGDSDGRVVVAGRERSDSLL